MPSLNLVKASKKIKIAILWTQLSGYLNACLLELAKDKSVELFLSHESASVEAPYNSDLFSWVKNKYEWSNHPDQKTLLRRLEDFSPDLILSSGWNIKEHRVVLKGFRNRSVRLISVDNQWMGKFKQYIGLLISKYYLHPICDGLFVAGERQANFAKKLGFTQKQIFRGVLSCDFDKFSDIFLQKQKKSVDPKAFIYVGRLSKEKGIDVMVNAYRKYRMSVSEPWPLRCYGAGPETDILRGIDGVELHGFVQPNDLPNEFLIASCLVLASKFEPWALVVHEAAAAGLGIICTETVGSSVHLVQKGHNGYIVENGSVEELAKAMEIYTSLSDEERREIGFNSYQLASQFTPRRWAKTLTTLISLRLCP